MATGTILLPIPGNFDSTTPPRLELFNSKPRVLFSDSSDDIMHWTFRMPENYASGLSLKMQYSMVSDITNTVDISVEVMAHATGDTVAIDADSYDTANTSNNNSVPATTAGKMGEISITLTNADSIAATEWCAIKFKRLSSTDDAVGDMELVAASLEYTTS
jgi:hypothetical protein